MASNFYREVKVIPTYNRFCPRCETYHITTAKSAKAICQKCRKPNNNKKIK